MVRLFRMSFTALAVTGTYLSLKENNGKSRINGIVSKIWCLLLIAFWVLAFAIAGQIWFMKPGLNAASIVAYVFFDGYIVQSIGTAMFMRHISRKGSKFRSFCNRLKQIAKIRPPTSRQQLFLLIAQPILVIIGLTMAIINTLSWVKSDIIPAAQVLGLWNSLTRLLPHLKIPVLVLHIVSIWGYFVWPLTTLLFFTVAVYLHQIFENFYKKLDVEFRRPEEIGFVENAQCLICDYIELLDLVDGLNDVFGVFVLFLVVSLLMIVTTSFYLLCIVIMQGQPIIQSTAINAFGLTQLLVVAWPAATIYEDQERMVDYCQTLLTKVLKMPNGEPKTQLVQMLRSVMQLISCKSFGVSLVGFTTVTKPFIVTALSLVFTYVVLIIQFQAPSEAGSFDAPLNSTA